MTLGWRGSRQGINRGEDLWGKDRVKSERSEGGANVKQHTAAFFSLLDYGQSPQVACLSIWQENGILSLQIVPACCFNSLMALCLQFQPKSCPLVAQ